MSKQQLVIDDIPWNLNVVINKCKRHWAVYSNEKKRWKELISIECKKQKLKKIKKKCDISVMYVFPDLKRRDPDNMILKFELDGIVNAGILKDDSFNEINSITIKSPKIIKHKKQTIIEMRW